MGRPKDIRYQVALLAVKDVEASKKFYGELLGQRVVLDLGKNVTFSGGFAVQEDFAGLTGIPGNSLCEKPRNMELYFETDDFDAFLERLRNYPGIEYVHQPKKHDWQQRVVRIYDPDGHMIEIGESMAVIAWRYLAQGYSAEQTAEVIRHPVAFVRRCEKKA